MFSSENLCYTEFVYIYWWFYKKEKSTSYISSCRNYNAPPLCHFKSITPCFAVNYRNVEAITISWYHRTSLARAFVFTVIFESCSLAINQLGVASPFWRYIRYKSEKNRKLNNQTTKIKRKQFTKETPREALYMFTKYTFIYSHTN